MIDLKQLSKRISYVLRHAPWEYELELDAEGWVPLEHLLEGLRSHHNLKTVERADIERVIVESDKARFELSGEKIRACYGHSVPGRIEKVPVEPPATLYHGTVPRFLDAIERGGLLPMSRQYVHLSSDTETAAIVARRRGQQIVILRIDAHAAWAAGVKFYKELNGVWLADAVGPEWITVPATAAL